MPSPKTIRGPALFISQFIGPPPLFSTLDDVATFAAGLGFKALQVPVHDPRFVDLERLDERGYVADIAGRLDRLGLVISEVSAPRAGQLVAVHPAYEDRKSVV